MKVRVRIAPSPTGALHVGTARTALFNFLFARKYGGAFILRIEDTDLERSNPDFEKDILQELRWLGVVWDEGPDIGGSVKPYRQSERLESYTEHLERLLANKRAYFCFCTQEELESEREILKQHNAVLRYSGKCAKLTPDELKQRTEKHKDALVRFVMPQKTIAYQDIIRGIVEFDAALFGDIAIAKCKIENGKKIFFPLYNFAAVVDDHEMHITHVLRGEDHIANTPKQIAIAEALEFPQTKYGHFPLILGSDRSKLSKRHGTATTVRELREAGYYSQAVVNFLALLGWNPGTEQETFTMEELLQAFDLSRIQNGGAIWNQEKLDWFNKFYAAREEPPENAVERIRHIFNVKGFGPILSVSGASTSIFSRVSPQELEAKIQDYSYYGFAPNKVSSELLRWKDMSDEDVKRSLHRSLEIFEKIQIKDWDRAFLEKVLIEEAAEWGNGDKGKLLWPLRTALSGQKRSDSPFEIAASIGKEETLHRVKKAIEGLS